MRLALAIVLLCLAAGSANADWMTEFGVGHKLPTTSFVLTPNCQQVTDNANGLHQQCGGDNPAFIGWPIAWESGWKGPWRVRAGWFHYSNWFDGSRYLNRGDEYETHMDVVAVTTTFNWTRRRKQ